VPCNPQRDGPDIKYVALPHHSKTHGIVQKKKKSLLRLTVCMELPRSITGASETGEAMRRAGTHVSCRRLAARSGEREIESSRRTATAHASCRRQVASRSRRARRARRNGLRQLRAVKSSASEFARGAISFPWPCGRPRVKHGIYGLAVHGQSCLTGCRAMRVASPALAEDGNSGRRTPRTPGQCWKKRFSKISCPKNDGATATTTGRMTQSSDAVLLCTAG